MICRIPMPRIVICGAMLLICLCAYAAPMAAQEPDNKNQDKKRQEAVDSGLRVGFVGRGKDVDQRVVVYGLGVDQLRRLAALAANDPNAWLDMMVVTVVSDDTARKARPMLGDYSINGKTLVFAPRFPFLNGTPYRIEVFSGANRKKPSLTMNFTRAEHRTAPTRLVAIYPSSNVLPENQLKFYLHFSSAMSRGEAYSRVRLLDQKGKQVEFPFLELGQELWDPSGSRFTLFFDPGRIKRGLRPRELFGPALLEGHSYTLVVDQTWEDANGQPLQETYRKRFKVVAPDDTQPVPKAWKMITPSAGTRQPLVVSFGEPLDHAMLHRVLMIMRGDEEIPGRLMISKQESQWSFGPHEEWMPGEYSLVVDAALEDLAGNSIGRPFEVDVFEKVEERPRPETIRLKFRIRP